MHKDYKVLLPKWVFEDLEREKIDSKKFKNYMLRYPDYVVTRIENGFAICDRIGRN